MKLSILDQSPVSEGSTPAEALRQTARFAREAEKLGYHRFWVSEHHAAPGLAGSSPEVLISHLAAVTSSIRIGSGAVLLPHYSAFKVAENFRVLEGLYPGRIDLGIGRALGGAGPAVRALQENRLNSVEHYEQQVRDLIAYLHGSAVESPHRFAGLPVTPAVSTAPEIWLLGSSKESAILASKLETGFAYAQFINGNGGREAVDAYRSGFRPLSAAAEPHALVSVYAVCADTAEEADRLAASTDLSLVLLEKGHVSTGIPSVEAALGYKYTPYDRFRIEENRRRMVVGTPEQVRLQLEQLAERYQCDEIMVGTLTHSFEDRVKSISLMAEACGLHRRSTHAR